MIVERERPKDLEPRNQSGKTLAGNDKNLCTLKTENNDGKRGFESSIIGVLSID